MASAEETERRRCQRRPARRLWATLAVALALISSFPSGWGPPLVAALLQRALHRQAPGATLRIRLLTPWRAEATGIRLGGAPDALGCQRLTVHFSPTGLWHRRVDSVELAGVRAAVAVCSSRVTLAGLEGLDLSSRKARDGPIWCVSHVRVMDLQVAMQTSSATRAVHPPAAICELSADIGMVVRRHARMATRPETDDGLGRAEPQLPSRAGQLESEVELTLHVPRVLWDDGRRFAHLRDIDLRGRFRSGGAVAEANLDGVRLSGTLVSVAGEGAGALQPWLPVTAELHGSWAAAAPGAADAAGVLNADGQVESPRLRPHFTEGAPAIQFAAKGPVANLEYRVFAARLGGPTGGTAGQVSWQVGQAALSGVLKRADAGGYATESALSLTDVSAQFPMGGVSNLCLRLPFSVETRAANGSVALRMGDAPQISWGRAFAGGMDFLCRDLRSVAPREEGVLADLRLGVQVAGSALSADVALNVATNGGSVALSIPATTLTTDDGLWQHLGSSGVPPRMARDALTLSGQLAATARVDWVRGQAPQWQAELAVTNGEVRVEDEQGWQIDGLATRLSAGGATGRYLPPVTTRFAHATLAGQVLDGGSVRWQWLGDELLVERAELAWCGGWVQLYAVRIDPRHPDLDFVLYLDRLEAGRLLEVIKLLKGSATGHLYGRMPLRVQRGRVMLSDGFLFALPGERGNLQLSDTRVFDEYLARSGLPSAVRKQISASLRNLDYHVLRFDLSAGGAPEARLNIKIEGQSAADRKLPPVSLDMRVNGPLEALLNFGLNMNKGKSANVE